jgi:hypothetical protein
MASKELHEYLAPLLWRSYACLACGHILFSPSCVLPSVRRCRCTSSCPLHTLTKDPEPIS